MFISLKKYNWSIRNHLQPTPPSPPSYSLILSTMADTEGSSGMKLPPGWTKGFSKSQQKTYYCHPASKHTQWHFPTVSEVSAKGSSSNTKPSSSLGDNQNQENPPKRQRLNNNNSNSNRKNNNKNPNSQQHDADSTCVAIIVPYRDIHVAQNRAKHLQKFIPHMHSFLQKQLDKRTLVDYHIYIIEQSDDGRKFNRGKLLNIGFDIARNNKCRGGSDSGSVNHNIFIFHDVDLLPGDDLGSEYTKFPKVPLHIARVWDRVGDIDIDTRCHDFIFISYLLIFL